MMEQIILSILASASVSAALFATLVWLSKSWLSERIRGAISHEYSVKLEAYKATLRTEFDKEIVTLKARLTLESDKETEILKASLKSDVDVAVEQMRSRLQMTAYEHQIRFQKLHERVADTIVETYAKLNDCMSLSSLTPTPRNPTPRLSLCAGKLWSMPWKRSASTTDQGRFLFRGLPLS